MCDWLKLSSLSIGRSLNSSRGSWVVRDKCVRLDVPVRSLAFPDSFMCMWETPMAYLLIVAVLRVLDESGRELDP